MKLYLAYFWISTTFATGAFLLTDSIPFLQAFQLSVFAKNKRAFHVYKKCGYKEWDRPTRDIKFLNETYTKRILLELPLK